MKAEVLTAKFDDGDVIGECLVEIHQGLIDSALKPLNGDAVKNPSVRSAVNFAI